MTEVKLTKKSDRCPECTSTNGEAYDEDYTRDKGRETISCRVFSCKDCGATTDFAWYDGDSKLNPNAVIDNINYEYEESK
tara:strand:+ start:776 stop:1015 length:240 start_codon:yes stop_codon:yes gene_type:complete